MGPMDQSTGFVLVQHRSGWIVWSLIPWFPTLVHFYVDSMMQRNGGECNFTLFFQSWRSVYFRHTFVINQAALHFWWFDGNRKTDATRGTVGTFQLKSSGNILCKYHNFAILSLTAWGPQQPGKYQKSIGPDLAFVWAGSEPSSPTWRAVGDVDNVTTRTPNSSILIVAWSIEDPVPKSRTASMDLVQQGPTNPITAMFSNLSVETRMILYSFVSIYCTI